MSVHQSLSSCTNPANASKFVSFFLLTTFSFLTNVLLGWSVRVKWSVKENVIIVLREKKDIWTKIFDVSLIPSHHRDQRSSCRFSLLRRAWGRLVTTFTDLLAPVGWSWMYPKPSWCHFNLLLYQPLAKVLWAVSKTRKVLYKLFF